MAEAIVKAWFFVVQRLRLFAVFAVAVLAGGALSLGSGADDSAWLFIVVGAIVCTVAAGFVRFLRQAARIKLHWEMDTTVHECGHALLFAVARGSHSPNVSVVVGRAGSCVSHDLTPEFMRSSAARRWLMLVCLAGRAAEITCAGSELLQSGDYVAKLDQLSESDGDGRRWRGLATQHFEEAAGVVTEAQIHARYAEDMSVLAEFFEENKLLMAEFADAVHTHKGRLTGEAVDAYLHRVRFTERVSPSLINRCDAFVASSSGNPNDNV